MQDEAITVPFETIGAIQDVIDAATEAIQELWLRATREEGSVGVPPRVEGFWRLHARIVHGDDPDIMDIF